ncbi:MAG TPA: hypothetical protein VLH09_02895, partial [Bryobacteraceae bacterium]|nr:hypothetical protein [Bryobacteraceae bacterium]
LLFLWMCCFAGPALSARYSVQSALEKWPAYSIAGRPATAVNIWPRDIAVDGAGALYFAEYPDLIRRIAPNGIVTKIAGGGSSQQDNVPALQAAFRTIWGMGVAADGTLWVTVFPEESAIPRIKTVAPSGNVTIAAGGGGKGATGDGGPAKSARLSRPTSVVLRGSDVWFIDYQVVRKISGGSIQTVAGTHGAAAVGQGGPLADSLLRRMNAMTSDPQGNYYFSDIYTHSVYKAPPDLSSITRVVGTGCPGNSSESGPGSQMSMNRPWDVEADSAGNIYISDTWNSRILKMTPDQRVTTIAGADLNNAERFTEGMSARRYFPESTGLHADKKGNLYFYETSGSVYRIAPGGTLHMFSSAPYDYSSGAIDFDSEGNAYIANAARHYIRKVAPNGTAAAFAGTGQAGFSGDGGQASAAALNAPTDLRVDAAGNVFVMDSRNNRIRRISPAGGYG